MKAKFAILIKLCLTKGVVVLFLINCISKKPMHFLFCSPSLTNLCHLELLFFSISIQSVFLNTFVIHLWQWLVQLLRDLLGYKKGSPAGSASDLKLIELLSIRYSIALRCKTYKSIELTVIWWLTTLIKLAEFYLQCWTTLWNLKRKMSSDIIICQFDLRRKFHHKIYAFGAS